LEPLRAIIEAGTPPDDFGDGHGLGFKKELERQNVTLF